MGRTYDWHFPLPRTHTGMLQGNGTLGVMIWGEDNVLRITVGRADFWDHRGGMPWRPGMSYANIRRLLEASDEQGLRDLFEQPARAPGEPERPTVLPLGRIELVLEPDARLTTGTLDLDCGRVTVTASVGGQERAITLDLSMAGPLLHVSLPAGGPPVTVRRVPAWQYVGDYLSSISFRPPQPFDDASLSGWVQERPADPALCLGYRLAGDGLWLAVEYGEGAEAARAAASAVIHEAEAAGAEALVAANAEWWSAYWARVPRLDVPNPFLTFLYLYGMYKFAGLTNPSGVPATLQGGWIEEYQMPPWSSDYHFNINVQMCYWPAYRGNLLPHLQPLFEMISSWKEQLAHNARIYLGIDDGYMLPHAVDDRGTCMGGFWTGSVDHGCTAWVAEMMYRYCRYTGDVEYLRHTVYPFMVRTMRVYEEVLEEADGGFRLPVGVSPEFRGAAMDAWGANASFQLACIHWLCRHLIEAADWLGEEPRPIWERIRRGLPPVALHTDPGGGEEIALWEGTALRESHRHHSHLAGLYPFDTIDRGDDRWRAVVERSLANWIREGMGLWSGWAMPWAAILHTTVGNADAAELLIEVWDRVFTNEGHGTLHDCQFPGFTLMGAGATASRRTRGEIMQMDAGMGITAAIMELLLHTRGGVNHLFAGAPARWAGVGFRGLRTDGAFLVSARREAGHVTEVEVVCEAGGPFRLANPWPGPAQVLRPGRPAETIEGAVLTVHTTAGERISLLPA